MKFEIRSTELEGRGVYATEDFRQGEKIMDLPEVAQTNPDMYSIELSPGIHVNCSDSPVGALNHSCEPNAAVRRGQIMAWNCIKAGEQIRIDYKKTESKLAIPFDCLCGSKFCRGRIE